MVTSILTMILGWIGSEAAMKLAIHWIGKYIASDKASEEERQAWAAWLKAAESRPSVSTGLRASMQEQRARLGIPDPTIH